MIICIGREFGSGGHEIGKRLAHRLEIPFLDKNFIELAAGRCGLKKETLMEAEEKKANFWLHETYYDDLDPELRGLPANDILFQVQKDIILEQAKRGSCVVVGRCADVVARQEGIRNISLFVTAPFDRRVERKKEILGLSEKETVKLVRQCDRRRKAYYNYYGTGRWGKPDNYDFCVNTSVYAMDDIVESLAVFAERKQNG